MNQRLNLFLLLLILAVLSIAYLMHAKQSRQIAALEDRLAAIETGERGVGSEVAVLRKHLRDLFPQLEGLTGTHLNVARHFGVDQSNTTLFQSMNIKYKAIVDSVKELMDDTDP